MIASEVFSPEARAKIASLSEVITAFPSALYNDWRSDFPSNILAAQRAQERRLNDAKNRLAALNRNVNSPQDRLSLEDVLVPGDDTLNLLTIEFLGRTGVIDNTPTQRHQAVDGIRTLRPEFEAIAADVKPKYSEYLGELATSEVGRITGEVEEFYDPYVFRAPLTAFEQFVGFTIYACMPEAESLQRAG